MKKLIYITTVLFLACTPKGTQLHPNTNLTGDQWVGLERYCKDNAAHKAVQCMRENCAHAIVGQDCSPVDDYTCVESGLDEYSACEVLYGLKK